MRILLTGATGYIGSRLAAECSRQGDEIHALVRPTSNSTQLAKSIGNKHLHVFDGSFQSVMKSIGDCKPDVVVHLASLFIVQHNQDQVSSLVESNVLFGSLLLEAMVANSVYRLVNTGSFWQHFDAQDRNPTNLYAATKSAFTEIVSYFVEATPLRAITLELPDTFGPDDPRRKIVNILIESIRSRSPLDLTGGEQMLDLVHVDDVVDAFRTAIASVGSLEARSSTFAVSSGHPVKLKELISFIASFSDAASCLRLGTRPYRFREVMVPWSGGIPLPGWQPRRRIEDFLKEQILSGDLSAHV